MEFKIVCPFHKQEETLKLPDSYYVAFKGEVPCGSGSDRATLHIEMHGEKIKTLRVVRTPAIAR